MQHNFSIYKLVDPWLLCSISGKIEMAEISLCRTFFMIIFCILMPVRNHNFALNNIACCLFQTNHWFIAEDCLWVIGHTLFYLVSATRRCSRQRRYRSDPDLVGADFVLVDPWHVVRTLVLLHKNTYTKPVLIGYWVLGAFSSFVCFVRFHVIWIKANSQWVTHNICGLKSWHCLSANYVSSRSII